MISVVIPTLNEEKTINNTITQLKKAALGKDFEIIVADASKDNKTIKAIKDKKVKVIKSKKGRAVQMNKGAKAAKGKVVLFVHSDSKMPNKWDQLINKVINQNYDGGCFLKQFDSRSLLMHAISFLTNLRALLLYDIMGDNCIFIKKSIFRKMRGYKEMELMEDVEFTKRLKKSKTKIIREKVKTSARRFEKFGIVKTILLMQRIRLAYELGADPKRLKNLYSDEK